MVSLLRAGGRAMEVKASPHPVLIDRFLQEAVEVDLDLVCDATGACVVGGVLEHVEEALRDAACVLPPHSLSPEAIERLKDIAIARRPGRTRPPAGRHK